MVMNNGIRPFIIVQILVSPWVVYTVINYLKLVVAAQVHLLVSCHNVSPDASKCGFDSWRW